MLYFLQRHVFSKFLYWYLSTAGAQQQSTTSQMFITLKKLYVFLYLAFCIRCKMILCVTNMSLRVCRKKDARVQYYYMERKTLSNLQEAYGA